MENCGLVFQSFLMPLFYRNLWSQKNLNSYGSFYQFQSRFGHAQNTLPYFTNKFKWFFCTYLWEMAINFGISWFGRDLDEWELKFV
jgi:hypothetical protein